MSNESQKKQPEAQANRAAPDTDPISAWRSLSDATLDSWAKAMVQFVNTEDYAKSTGAMLNSYLEAAQPQKKLYEQMMTRALAHSNMPSRDDLLSLAERMTNLEMRLDDIDAKLDLALDRPVPPAVPASSERARVKPRAGASRKSSSRKAR